MGNVNKVTAAREEVKGIEGGEIMLGHKGCVRGKAK